MPRKKLHHSVTIDDVPPERLKALILRWKEMTGFDVRKKTHPVTFGMFMRFVSIMEKDGDALVEILGTNEEGKMIRVSRRKHECT